MSVTLTGGLGWTSGRSTPGSKAGLNRHGNRASKLTRVRNTFFIALTLLVASVTPAVAADSPVNDAYGSTASTLPFSGLDLGLIAAGGLMLVALGFGLRRATHTP